MWCVGGCLTLWFLSLPFKLKEVPITWGTTARHNLSPLIFYCSSQNLQLKAEKSSPPVVKLSGGKHEKKRKKTFSQLKTNIKKDDSHPINIEKSSNIKRPIQKENAVMHITWVRDDQATQNSSSGFWGPVRVSCAVEIGNSEKKPKIGFMCFEHIAIRPVKVKRAAWDLLTSELQLIWVYPVYPASLEIHYFTNNPPSFGLVWRQQMVADPPLAPKIFFKIKQFSGKPLFWANLGSGPNWDQNSTGPLDQNPGSAPVNRLQLNFPSFQFLHSALCRDIAITIHSDH